MKNRSILLAFVFSIGLLSTSCTSDDNEGETLAPLQGRWDISKVGTTVGGTETLIDAPQNQSGCERDYMELRIGSTLVQGDYSSTVSPCFLTTEEGIYTRSHNNLTRVIDGQTITQDILNLTLNELKLRDASTGNVEVYIRHQ